MTKNEEEDFLAYVKEYNSSDISKVFLEKDYGNAAIDFLPNKARTLNYFKAEGLLPERQKKSNFSFVELIWVRIVFELRSIGVRNDLIKKARLKAFEPLADDVLSEIMKEAEVEMLKALDIQGQKIPKEYREGFFSEMRKIIKTGAYAKDYIKNNITIWLAYTIQAKAASEIRLYIDGEVEFYTFVPKMMIPRNAITKSYVSISLTKMLSFYLSKDFIDSAILNSAFSEEELLILDAVRDDGYKSVKVTFSDGSVDMIELEKEKFIDINQRLSEIFLSNAYEDVTIKTQKGKIVSCKKITKVKSNKSKKNTG